MAERRVLYAGAGREPERHNYVRELLRLVEAGRLVIPPGAEARVLVYHDTGLCHLPRRLLQLPAAYRRAPAGTQQLSEATMPRTCTACSTPSERPSTRPCWPVRRCGA